MTGAEIERISSKSFATRSLLHLCSDDVGHDPGAMLAHRDREVVHIVDAHVAQRGNLGAYPRGDGVRIQPRHLVEQAARRAQSRRRTCQATKELAAETERVGAVGANCLDVAA